MNKLVAAMELAFAFIIALLLYLQLPDRSRPDRDDALRQMFPGFELGQNAGWFLTYDNGFRDGPGRYIVEANARNAKIGNQPRECLFRLTEKGWLVDRTTAPCGVAF